MFRLGVAFKTVKNRLGEIRAHIRGINNSAAVVGWEGTETYPGTQLTVAQVAVFNEYGTTGAQGRMGIPARPFMRQAYQRNLPAIIANRNEAYQSVISGRATPQKALMMMGYRFQEMVRREIIKGDFTQNAARTLARKRAGGQGGRPLIASKRMLNAIRTRIILNGEDVTANTGHQNSRAVSQNAKAENQQRDRFNKAQGLSAARAARDKARQEDRRVGKQLRVMEKRERNKAKRLEKRNEATDKLAQQRAHEARKRELTRAFKGPIKRKTDEQKVQIAAKKEAASKRKLQQRRAKIDRNNLQAERDRRRASARAAFRRLKPTKGT